MKGLVGLSILVWMLSSSLSTQLSHAVQSDIDCLRSVKASLNDSTSNPLSTWDFKNGSQTHICNFTGITCWHQDDNNVINIDLSGMGLKGKFPSGLVNCKSMTGLNLSNNNLSGSIPKNIAHLIPLVTSLDLSYNRIHGKIPEDLVNCTFLNIIKLNNNNLTGPIPSQILRMDRLSRLKIFDVSNNCLSGLIPENPKNVSFSYANNSGLCGVFPLRNCPGR